MYDLHTYISKNENCAQHFGTYLYPFTLLNLICRPFKNYFRAVEPLSRYLYTSEQIIIIIINLLFTLLFTRKVVILKHQLIQMGLVTQKLPTFVLNRCYVFVGCT